MEPLDTPEHGSWRDVQNSLGLKLETERLYYADPAAKLG